MNKAKKFYVVVSPFQMSHPNGTKLIQLKIKQLMVIFYLLFHLQMQSAKCDLQIWMRFTPED